MDFLIPPLIEANVHEGLVYELLAVLENEIDTLEDFVMVKS